MKKTLFIFLGLIAWVPTMSYAQVANAPTSSEVMCTMDAMLCPDGITSVGRVAPTCAFAPCPQTDSNTSQPITCVNLQNNFRVGATDAFTSGEVSVLQEFLYPRYLSVRPTGRFLGMTQSAVIAFQRDQGISPMSGIVGPLTRAKIRDLTCGSGGSTSAPVSNPALTPAPTPLPTPVTTIPGEAITIAALDPSSARVGQSVIIRGNNFFRPETKLLFDGMSIPGRPVYERATGAFNSAFQFTVPSSIVIECIRVKPTDPCPLVPARLVTPGVYQISVENNLGRASVNFTVLGANEIAQKIEITSLSPSAGAIGTEVVIRGTGLSVGNDEIYFGGSLVSRVSGTVNDEFGTLRFRVPTDITPCGIGGQNLCRIASRPVTPGTYEVAVVNRNGTSNTITFTVTAPNTTLQPTITSLTPSSLRSGEVLTINGTNFPNTQTLGFLFLTNTVTGAQLPFIGATHLDNSPTQTRFTIPTTVPVGTYRASVRFSNGIQSAQSSQTIQIVTTVSTNAPQITSISPTTASPGAEITINGQRLNSGDPRVVLNDGIFVTPIAGRASDNVLVFTLPSVSAVPHTVRVVNSFGTSNAVTLNVVNQQITQTPGITSFTPTSVRSGDVLTVNGTNFPAFQTVAFLFLTNITTGVQLPAIGATHPESSPSRTQFTIPTTVSVGEYRLSVRFSSGTPSAQSAQTLRVTSNVNVSAPRINTISPTTASPGADITLTGTDLNTGDPRVVLNDSIFIIPDPARASANMLVFRLPAVSYGTFNVRVVNGSGTSNTVTLTVVAPPSNVPVISSLSPAQGVVGTRVTIMGSNINTNEEVVTFGGPLNYVNIIQPRQQGRVEFIVPSQIAQGCSLFTTNTVCPAGALLQVNSGIYEVAVVNRNGVSNKLNFTVTAPVANPPQINFISPTNTSVGAQITINGVRLGSSSDARILLSAGNNTGFIIPDSTRAQDGILTFLLPSSMSRYCLPGVMCPDDMIPVMAGTYSVTVVNSSGTSNAVTLGVSETKPSINSLSPVRGTVGTRVTILGQNISSQTDFVRFGSVRVTPDRSVKAANTVVFQVPNALLECNPTPTNPCLTIPLPTNMVYDLTVERPNGNASNMLTFQVLAQDLE